MEERLRSGVLKDGAEKYKVNVGAEPIDMHDKSTGKNAVGAMVLDGHHPSSEGASFLALILTLFFL